MPNFKLSNEFENYELSSGTLRTEDLIHTFVNFLNAHAPEVLPEDYELFEDGQSWVEGDYWEEQAQWDLNQLFDILDEIAPEGCYFGSLDGDGSCFGFWKLEEDF